MFDDTVTVYNKYSAAGVEKWQRTTLTGVFWNAIKGAVTRRTGVQTVDSLQLIIPKMAQASRGSYNPPKAWNALTDKTGTWTLQPGDTIVRGSLSVDISTSPKELSRYDDVLTITSADYKDFGGGMAHWEVSGK